MPYTTKRVVNRDKKVWVVDWRVNSVVLRGKAHQMLSSQLCCSCIQQFSANLSKL